MEEFHAEFLAEAEEMLGIYSEVLGRMRCRGTGNREALGEAFRCIHTITGNSGFMGFQILGDLTGAGEELLALLEKKGTEPTAADLDLLEDLLTECRRILEKIREKGNDGQASMVIGRLRVRLSEPGGIEEVPSS